ncbi:hypothetical protein HDE_10705 [Halotydeus destructor]|nr:hypothetical protein HDE_10705 [Halotydeus destructor]
MACCGATLRTVTNLAGIFTLINFIFFFFLDGFLIACLRFPQSVLYNPSLGFEIFVNGFQGLSHPNVLFVLFIVRIVFRFTWMLTVPLLFVGNRNEKQSYIILWEKMSYIIILSAILFSTYFIAANYECGYLSEISDWLRNLTSRNPKPETGLKAAKFAIFFSLMDASILFLIHYKKREESNFLRWTAELRPYRIPRAKLAQPKDLSLTSSSTASKFPKESTLQSSRTFSNQGAIYENAAYDPTLDENPGKLV